MIDQAPPPRPATAAARPVPGPASSLLRGALGPVVCSVLLLALLSAWVVTGGAGRISRVRIDITAASVPAPTSAGGPTAMYLTVVNLSRADRLVSVTTPAATRVEFVQHDGSALGPGRRLTGIAIPARATVNLSPFGADLVFVGTRRLTVGDTVPVTLSFAAAGSVTVQASVTPPGTP